MFNNATLCLNMIVKDEAHIIESTLENLCGYFNFNYWIISDTGSNDNTMELIQNFFIKKGIPGELLEHQWRDFGFNRTRALEAAYDKTDYILFWDADDKMVGCFPPEHIGEKKMYYLKKSHGISNYVPLLVCNRMKWEYIGVLHEYLNNKEPISLCDKYIVIGDYEIKHQANGASYNDPDKYKKHGDLLEKAYNEENNQFLKNRYAFYCGQSYKDCRDYDKAIKWYTIVLNQDNIWDQERYYSYLMLGKIYFMKGNDYFLDAILHLEKGAMLDFSREECISYLMEYYYTQNMHGSVMAWFTYFKEKKSNIILPDDNKLFFDSSRMYYVYYYASISAYYTNDFLEGKKALTFLIENITSIPNFMHNIIIENKKFYDM